MSIAFCRGRQGATRLHYNPKRHGYLQGDVPAKPPCKGFVSTGKFGVHLGSQA
jgi:hypothetical protein